MVDSVEGEIPSVLTKSGDMEYHVDKEVYLVDMAIVSTGPAKVSVDVEIIGCFTPPHTTTVSLATTTPSGETTPTTEQASTTPEVPSPETTPVEPEVTTRAPSTTAAATTPAKTTLVTTPVTRRFGR